MGPVREGYVPAPAPICPVPVGRPGDARQLPWALGATEGGVRGNARLCGGEGVAAISCLCVFQARGE
eukprot:6751140-Lingulodinium_polyedra.AAC.1